MNDNRSERRQIEAIATATKGVEDQVREHRAILSKLEMHTERIDGALESALNRLQALAYSQETLTAEVRLATAAQDLLHQLNDQMSVTLERQKAIESRVEDFAKQRLSTVERERVERDGVARRLETAERTTITWNERLVVVEEIGRRLQESQALLNQKTERLERTLESVEARAGRNLESAKRLETELRQIESLVDTLQRQDDAILERIQLLNEVVRRVEDAMALIASQESRFQELVERIELQRVERHRVDETLTRLEHMVDEQRSLMEQALHIATSVDGRQKGIIDRIDRVVEESEAFREQISGQLIRFVRVQERQKRRQIQDLETEIRDMKRHVIVEPTEQEFLGMPRVDHDE